MLLLCRNGSCFSKFNCIRFIFQTVRILKNQGYKNEVLGETHCSKCNDFLPGLSVRGRDKDGKIVIR